MEEPDCTEAVDQAMDMFGSVLSRSAIESVVVACGGDLTQAIEVIVTMTDNQQTTQSPNETQAPVSSTPSSAASYANAFKSSGAVPKTTRESRNHFRNISHRGSDKTLQTLSPRLNEQLRRIIEYHEKGYRILVIMRGAPGSGKSTLACQIIDMTVGGSPVNYKSHIFSSDNFFSRNGAYVFDVNLLGQAHEWNQKSVKSSLCLGLSPVIVDNTHTELWEMKSYIVPGVDNGYFFEIVEPHTPWARNCQQLVRKNTHGVPYGTIRRMLDLYQPHQSNEYILNMWNLIYPTDKFPPVLRLCPPVQKTIVKDITQCEASEIVCVPNDPNCASKITNMLANLPCPITEEPTQDTTHLIKTDCKESTEMDEKIQQRLIDYQLQFEEFKKIESEWESGPKWDETSKTHNGSPSSLAGPRPQRDPKSRDHSRSRSRSSVRLSTTTDNPPISTEWQMISNSIPDWNLAAIPNVKKPPSVVEKVSSGTLVEYGDSDISQTKGKVVSTKLRDINFYYIPPTTTIIPQKRMLDKSSMTNDEIDTELYRCKNQDKHFISFRKMFKQFAEVDLKDIFDKCCGDVHWASEIVLDGVQNNDIAQSCNEEASSDTEEEALDCDCISTYSIVPKSSEPTTPTAEVVQLSTMDSKKKKDKAPSESSIQLKRQIEKNINISDHYYSNNSLKLRKLRRGEVLQKLSSLPHCDVADCLPSTSSASVAGSSKLQSHIEPLTLSSDEDCSESGESEETVNLNLGADLIIQLNDHFNNRQEIKFAEHIIPVVSMPMSLLNQLNALWLESLAHQIEMQGKFSEVLLKEDEEFARQLAEKEAEYEQAGKEPEVPDFKEIMDMDLAMTLYQKDISEWRNSEPTDMASKLSRDKLYNLFPEYEKDILSEILLAHDNNFQSTVEVLLTSSGKAEVLEEKNGLNKFVMNKEIERQEKALEDERRKVMTNEEWPLLCGARAGAGTEADKDLESVNSYRKEAQQHLERRNYNYNKAQEYFRRGMTQVASYYATLADFHKSKFDQANHFAASHLIQVNSASHDSTTLDLHYLFVAEAMQTLDLFLDHHVGQLAAGGAWRTRELYLITGRGLHSQAGPRIKPAVKRRLQERALKPEQVNPGLLKVTVTPDDKLTHQIE